MNTRILTITVVLTAGLLIESTLAQALPEGYWSLEQATGILRVLQQNQPRPDQPYQTMQLMQMNYVLELSNVEI